MASGRQLARLSLSPQFHTGMAKKLSLMDGETVQRAEHALDLQEV